MFSVLALMPEGLLKPARLPIAGEPAEEPKACPKEAGEKAEGEKAAAAPPSELPDMAAMAGDMADMAEAMGPEKADMPA